MLLGKKCRNLRGGIISYLSEYFPHAENLELLFCSTAFVDKIIRGNIIFNLLHQLWLIWGNICRKKRGERSLLSRTFPLFGKYFSLINHNLQHSLFSRTFPLFGKYFSLINHNLQHSLFSWTFPLFGKYFSLINHNLQHSLFSWTFPLFGKYFSLINHNLQHSLFSRTFPFFGK